MASTTAPFSRRSESRPARLARMAASMPMGPAPTMTTSFMPQRYQGPPGVGVRPGYPCPEPLGSGRPPERAGSRRPARWAHDAQRTDGAVGPPGVAHAAAVEDQGVVQEDPFGWFEQRAQVGLHLVRVLLLTEP